MADVLFSSWTKEIIDNRGVEPDKRRPLEGVKIPEKFGPEHKVRAVIGWNGLVVMDEKASVPDLTRAYLEALQQTSCGKCIPCRVGTRVARDIMGRIATGRGEKADLDRIAEICRDVMTFAKCDIGKIGPVPVLHALEHFRDQFEALIEEKKPLEKGEYKWIVTAPCKAACPAAVDIPAYLELIKEKRFEESLAVVRERCPMPGTIGRVCVRPCEFNCRRQLLDDPVQIKFLKRFVADHEREHRHEPALPPVRKNGRDKVAIIGAGPAGLSAAYYLGLMGYPVTIFEMWPEGGGMAAVGIPDYRLPRDILRYELEAIKKTGAQIYYEKKVGKDITLDDIKEQGYKAILIAVGAHESRKMGCEGEDAGYEGFVPGVKFLREIALTGHAPVKGRRIGVVGGGNVAIDCARSAFRVGFEEVYLLYRRTRKEMPADDVEIEDAEKEGVQFHFLTLPKKILAKNGKVVGLECIRMELGEPDESGRRRPVPIEGSEFTIDLDVVIPAIGQSIDLSFIEEEKHGVKKTRRDTVVVDPETFMTNQPGIFSAGDCVTGPDVLVNALAQGRDAAISIDQYLREGRCCLPEERRLERIVRELGVYDETEMVDNIGGWHKAPMPHLPPDTRKHTFEEVEKGFRAQDAIKEAERCMRCYRIFMLNVEKV